MPPKMTKQPARPTRYFARPYDVNEPASDEESESEEEAPAPAKAPPPKVTSFPKISAPSQTLPKAPEASKQDDLEGFETASESSDEEDGDNGSDDDEGSSEEEESSDDEPKRPMLAPKFISKAKRAQQESTRSVDDQAAEMERIRKEKADEMLQMQMERDAAARKAGKKNWDDDDVPDMDDVDDTDGLDPEAEHAAWKLRELKRVRRDRQALIAQEKEREEIERRRNMTAEEREAEDRGYLAAQAEEKEGKGKMQYMQKYFHKGAFFNNDEEQDEEVKAALNRDLAGYRLQDEAADKGVLPEYMRIRDSTKLGKSGRSKYKDLKSEDTGTWGRFEGKKREFDGLDERFRPDEGGGPESTGANSAPIGERRPRDGGDEKRVRRD
ncbi:Microfibrillar-associated protein 1 [Fulvia fulva]|nr:Microfibrillar-associated protein 1 [Fulvia fulva]KAK4633649.1 Microfibrillar-associated protein 1 [Fulvia fulva]WPV11186.1 Microfibrillar-associated protein 1 [Fulvia fulva]WPV25816.1 Microfibrillar-associated protein 1 [Fulvia fulva]